MIKPVDAAKGNGGLVYEVANRGGKAILAQLQLAMDRLPDPNGGRMIVSAARLAMHGDDPSAREISATDGS
jgi:hypothetical protein